MTEVWVTPWTAPQRSQHTGYFKRNAGWHKEFELTCKYRVCLSSAQKLVDLICEDYNVVAPQVVYVPNKPGEELVAGCTIYHRGAIAIGLGSPYTPVYVLLHEVAHYLEYIFHSRSVLRRMKRDGWEHSHSTAWWKLVMELATKYECYLR